jgi:hypothetical protein
MAGNAAFRTTLFLAQALKLAALIGQQSHLHSFSLAAPRGAYAFGFGCM